MPCAFLLFKTGLFLFTFFPLRVSLQPMPKNRGDPKRERAADGNVKLLVQMAALLAMPKSLALLQPAINSTEGLFVLGEGRTKAALQRRHRTSESGGTGSFFRQENYRAHCSSST